MGKPRRPRGGRSNWEPKPPLDAKTPAPAKSLTDTSVADESLSDLPADESAPTEPAPSSATFAHAEPAGVESVGVEPVMASTPEADPVAPAEHEAQAASADADGGDAEGPRPVPEAEARDSAVQGAMPREADRDGERRRDADDRDAPEEPVAVRPADPETDLDAAPVPEPMAAAPAPLAAGPAAANRIVFAPDRIDIVEIGSTIARYVQGEGAAALAHFRALSDVRTPADLIRLQVGEVQRAADASLTCWVAVMGKASRVVALR